MSTKKWLALSAGVLGVVLLIGVSLAGWTHHKVSVSQTMAQMVVEKELPKMKGHGVAVHHMELSFHDTADVLIEVEGSKLGKHFTMVVQAQGQPDLKRSKNANGDIYFEATNIEIRDFSFSGSKPGEMLKRAADRYLIKHPGAQNALNDAAPHIENWMKTFAEISAVKVLNHVPIYKLKDDWKGWFASASIVNAKVVGSNLEITYSMWALAGMVLLVVIVGILAVILCLGLIALEIL